MKKVKLRLTMKTIRVLADSALPRGAGTNNGSQNPRLCSGSCVACPPTWESCYECNTADSCLYAGC